MPRVAVEVRGISKRFVIGALDRNRTLRDKLAEALSAPFRGTDRAREEKTTLWALRDVSFDVDEGQVFGIIGRNGAGKSTLLKVLSRITKPTEGAARIRGRVVSLLEIGTGFHPELTGRENIFLNGAILGMSRAEINRRFDEIVAFSEVERFIDTPVKRYSSGMYLRLAFAVAAHLEPDILIVDEVLAVGDSAFQRKCIGRMGAASREGRTVLLVSHNLTAVQSLCTKALLLEKGRVGALGETQDVIMKYMRDATNSAGQRVFGDGETARGRKGARLVSCQLVSDDGEVTATVTSGRDCRFRVGFIADSAAEGSFVAVHVSRFDSLPVLSLFSFEAGMFFASDSQEQVAEVTVPNLPLFPGLYILKLGLCDSSDVLYDYCENAMTFEVLPEIGRHRVYSDPRAGVVHVGTRWRSRTSREVDGEAAWQDAPRFAR
jgi:lipopolysaccharide transport system ATP-binding protein